MPRNSGSHGDDRHGHHSNRRSSDERRSSSKHNGRSSSSRRSSSKREGGEESARSKSHSTRSTTSRSKSQQSAFSYGPNGKKKNRLMVVDHSTDSDSSHDEIATEPRTRSWKSYFWIAVFIVAVIIAVVVTYLLMKDSGGGTKSKKISNNGDNGPEIPPLVEVVPTKNPTVAPTGMPTVEYPPPDLAVCQALSEGQDMNDGSLLPRNMDISFDVIIRPGGPFKTEEAVFEYFPHKLESVLIPILAGCGDVQGFQRKLASPQEQQGQRALLDDDLEQIRYVVGGGAVTGTKYNEIQCPASTSGQLVSCFNVIVYFEFLLKGDERVFQVMSLISTRLLELSSNSAVEGLGLPNPPFQKVVVNGVRNNDPTVSPSVSPTQFPTDRPSSSPSLEPTNKPSASPSSSPTSKPSSRPTATPSVSPTKGPTRSPTKQPSKSPTVVPSVAPTGLPSAKPSTTPSVEPSLAPSAMPSLSNAPSLSQEPSLAPSISNAPTSRVGHIIGFLPPSWNDTFAIDWLANDTWWVNEEDTEDESPFWAERYALVLFSKQLGGFAQSGSSVCNWQNITCDENGRVTDVELPYNNLIGGIPTELSAFSEMTRLDLSHNTYTGTTIPTELFRLVKIEYLDISSSGISGTIPTQIANLLSLREMHLNSNNLIGTIPPLPDLVQRPHDAVISLGNGVTTASVCEMYGNELTMTTVSSANAGGCDLVRTASDSSSSSSSSSDDSSSAPATRFRYRSIFRHRNRALESEEEESSYDDDEDDEDSLRKRIEKFRSPVYDIAGVRTPQLKNKRKRNRRVSKKTIKHQALGKHPKKAKKHNFPVMDAEEFNAEFNRVVAQRSGTSDIEEPNLEFQAFYFSEEEE